MAKSVIERGNKWLRPAFNFLADEKGTYQIEHIIGQLTESIRNVLEGIADSQMLSCETRADIRRTREAVEKLVRLAQAKRRKPPMKRKR